MSTFHLINFGCRASQADGTALKRQLLELGLGEAAKAEESHVAVLNTCTVTATSDAEVRQIIRRIPHAGSWSRVAMRSALRKRSPNCRASPGSWAIRTSTW
jgi:threonylcarbamoyladenosine tRNA methylthiotransferase MtaB